MQQFFAPIEVAAVGTHRHVGTGYIAGPTEVALASTATRPRTPPQHPPVAMIHVGSGQHVSSTEVALVKRAATTATPSMIHVGSGQHVSSTQVALVKRATTTGTPLNLNPPHTLRIHFQQDLL